MIDATMLNPATSPLLKVLCNLRWLAIAGQSVTVALVTGPMHMALPPVPLWTGIAALALFNVFATWRARTIREPSEAEVFGHIVVDILVLTWLVAWSGGIENPFSSVFLLPIALSVLALPARWIWATAVTSVLGYGMSAWLAPPLPHAHGAIGDAFSLHKFGMMVSFIVSVAVILVFFRRMAAAWRNSEREVAQLRERFARNEGIVALATHAASVAHELNTPLATLTLMVEDLAGDATSEARREDYATMRALLDDCRNTVRELARPADADHGGIELERVVTRWQLVRPTVDLHRTGSVELSQRIDPAVGHLLQALLNNAADASEQAGTTRVDLRLEADRDSIRATIRDHGAVLGRAPALLPGTLFHTNKPGGLGIGLALSHATVERLGGTLSMQAAADGPGIVVSFQLPMRAPA